MYVGFWQERSSSQGVRVGLDRIKPFVLKLSIFSVAVMSICLIIWLVDPIGSERVEELEWGVGDRLHALGL